MCAPGWPHHRGEPAAGYALAQVAADVVAFMDAVGIPAAVLLGSSSGGYVAQQVAITSPHRVTGLALVGSPCSLQGRPSFADEVIVYPDTGHLVLWEQPER